MNERLEQLRELRDRGKASLTALAQKAIDEKREFTDAEGRIAKQAAADVRELDRLIEHRLEEMVRAGFGDPDVHAIRAAARHRDGWANGAADVIRKANGETRAISSGSVDLPVLVDPAITPKSRPSRLIDLLVNRAPIESNAFEYFRQTARVTNAAAVPDLAAKPTSTYTLAPINDRARVIAHLSEPVPIRLWQDAEAVVQWLDAEMRAGVEDALEGQVISGSGTNENLLGILNVPGTTAVPYAVDVPTTLRKAITALQIIGVDPNALVLNPADAEALDLLREGAGGVGYLLDGYQNGTASSANVLGPNSIQRVVSPSVPAGVAVLADWSQVKLFVREQMRLDIDAGGELFKQNAAIMRAEIRVGLGHLRPASFAIADLTP